MPRARSPERDLAYQLWLDSGKKKKLKDIAEELGVSETLIRKWKNQDNWNGNVTNPANGNVTKQKAVKAAKKIEKNTELDDRQKLFCIYFVNTFNATSAYQKAYGCSYSAAAAAGSRLLTNVKVREEIKRLKQERYTRAFLEPEDIFRRYMDIAFADMSDLLSWGRELVPVMSAFGPVTETDPETGEKVPVMREVNVVKLKDSSEVDTSLVGEVKQGRDGVSIKLPDRMKALEWLADHMDMATAEQKARTEKIIAETEKLRAGYGTEDDDMVLQFIKGMKDGTADT